MAGTAARLIPATVSEELPVVYRDDWLVAIHKPAGLLVHRSAIDRHETRFAIQMLRDQLGQRVWPVHRLDKPTSGVLLFALDPHSARLMSDRFAERETQKSYLAVVRGHTRETETIDYPLREELDKLSDANADQDKPAQTAVTEYRRLGTMELPHAVGRYATARYSLLRVSPLTGRKHQIRRHMKHIFHPIVGDTTHGDGKHNAFFREQLDCHRLLLAAHELSFRHPVSGESVCIRAEPDAGFRRIMDRFDYQTEAQP